MRVSRKTARSARASCGPGRRHSPTHPLNRGRAQDAAGGLRVAARTRHGEAGVQDRGPREAGTIAARSRERRGRPLAEDGDRAHAHEDRP